MKTRTPKRPADRPSVDEFAAGKKYTVRQVAALFGRTGEWVRQCIRDGRLTASKPDWIDAWLIDGASVLALHASLRGSLS